ncbi:MAG: COG4705 family protein [Chthoniobacterales bacterium]
MNTKLLNKVPAVTLIFWIIKIMATTVGETAADFLSVKMKLGLNVTSFIMAGLLLVALVVQFKAKRYTPAFYWTVVVFISVMGTLISDNLVDNLGVSLATTSIIFGCALIIVFVVWYLSEKTLSVHTIFTNKREAFYWAAILFTFALGTSAGDLIGESLGLGYPLSALMFGGTIAVIYLAYRYLNLNAVLAFWLAYILTRPLGASLGDLLTQPHKAGGLGVSTTIISSIFLVSIIILVTYLTIWREKVSAVESDEA